MTLGVICIIFSLVSSSRGQIEETTSQTIIENTHPGISYFPAYCSSETIDDCIGAWWDTKLTDGSLIKTTNGPDSQYEDDQTSFNYSFYGSSVEIHGLSTPSGPLMIIQIDDYLTMANTSFPDEEGGLQRATLFNHTGLDPNIQHYLAVAWCANPDASLMSSLFFEHLVVRDFREATIDDSPITSSIPATPTSSTPSTSGSSVHSKRKPIAGIVVAILSGLFLLSFSVYCIFRRRLIYFFKRRNPNHYKDFTIDTIHSPVLAHLRLSKIETPPDIESLRNSTSVKPSPPSPSYPTKSDDKPAYTSLKSTSYLDLESGSENSSRRIASDDERLEENRSVPSSSANSRPSLRISTSNKATDLRASMWKESADGTRRSRYPDTPYTSYCFETATVVRPQIAQVLPSLPPAAKTLNSKVRRPITSEGSRQSKARSKYSRTSSHTYKAGNRPTTSSSRATNYLDMDSEDVGTSRYSRPSFDSVHTRSVPPPYALFP